MRTTIETVARISATERDWSRRARIYVLEARYEFVKLLRMPAYALPILLFPAVFYVFFGLSFGAASPGSRVSMATYLIATYGAFGVIGASLFGFGVGVALERGQGWMLLKRATPMPPTAYFLAKMVMSLAFSTLIVLLLSALGVLFGGVRMSAGTWLRLVGILIAGAIPFSACGLAIGYFAGPNSAPPIINLVYLPLSFASGLWVPIQFLPKFLKNAAHFLPTYHYAQLALNTIGAGLGGSFMSHVLVLVGFTSLCLVVAYVGYLREEDKTYG
ncbi:MAG: ABC transporter permease [Gemmatimonadaceae bacterium]